MPDGADLEHHHAHGVSDDVVELTGDPGALLCHREAGSRLTFAFGVLSAFFSRFGLLGALTERVARDPGDHEPERDEDEVADRLWTGDVVDDSHDPDEDEDQTGTCLQPAPQVPEQERARQPDDAEAADEREQQSVAERDRRGQEPIHSRGGEREAPTCKSGRTRTATVGMEIQSVVGGAPGASRPTTSSSMPAIARNAISSSNQYSRVTSRMRLMR